MTSTILEIQYEITDMDGIRRWMDSDTERVYYSINCDIKKAYVYYINIHSLERHMYSMTTFQGPDHLHIP
jgi:hypothetical protein